MRTLDCYHPNTYEVINSMVDVLTSMSTKTFFDIIYVPNPFEAGTKYFFLPPMNN